MAKTKKYDYRVVQDDTGWTTEITRKISSKKTGVSKSQSGFATEADAEEWGKKELKLFLKTLDEQNKRHSEKRNP